MTEVHFSKQCWRCFEPGQSCTVSYMSLVDPADPGETKASCHILCFELH